MKNTVISASAGSGKTHRLAIEYIALLIKNLHNPEFHFERILVITFTRKAAAEIRNKIFEMLKQIIEKDQKITEQIEQKTNIKINTEIHSHIYKIYVQIKTQKDKVRISTIDALINQVFKTMIAPIMKISNYTIDEKANHTIWETIFDELIKEKNIDTIYNLTLNNPKKDIKAFAKIFENLINDRWILHQIKKEQTQIKDNETHQAVIENLKKEFRTHCIALHYEITKKMEEKQKTYAHYLTNLAKDIFKCEINETNFSQAIENFLNHEIYKLSKTNISQILKDNAIKLFNANHLRTQHLKDVEKLKTAFATFVYHQYVIPETQNIIELWQHILTQYDKIKIKNAILSYDDITWYTYKHLHDPEYSMIDEQRFIVENQFYEFLAVRNQYLLIDEFQDTSLMQFMILAPMINELAAGYSIYDDSAVIIVGDEKQSIYGWRGGEKELLNYMQRFLNAKTESLDTCYRSTPEIVEYINYIFQNIKYPENETTENEKWQYPKEIISAIKDKKGAVTNYFYQKENDDKDAPYFKFVNNLIKEMQNTEKHSTTAIIARENKDLDKIALLLAERQIPFVRESSRSIIEHTIPKAIINLLKYIQYKDNIALLKFLRSDIILIGTKELKEIAIAIKNNETLPNYKQINIINEIEKQYQNTKEIDSIYKNPLTICHKIIEKFKIAKIFKNEVDMKNIHIFMKTIADFLNSNTEFPANIDGFIQYAEELLQKNSTKQQSTTQQNAIKLLTIHKSKGLGFDNVYVYIDTKKNIQRPAPLEIDFIVDKQSFHTLSHVFITMNYKNVITEIFKKQYENINQKRNIEEINNIYVALTRAKTKLYVFWTYTENDTENQNIKNIILKNAIQYKNTKIDETKIDDNEVKETKKTTNIKNIKKYYDIQNKKITLTKIETNEYLAKHLKELFLVKKNKLYGNTIHEYLAFIKYNTPEEHHIARLHIKKIYGNILTKKEIENTIKKTKNFINQNQEYFSKKWNKIFTEFSISDKQKRLHRIDRMLINTTQKEILIIDYKTGNIEDNTQIQTYINIIKNIKTYKNQNYSIQGKFILIEE